MSTCLLAAHTRTVKMLGSRATSRVHQQCAQAHVHAGVKSSRALLQSTASGSLSDQITAALLAGNTALASQLITQGLNSGQTDAVADSLASASAQVKAS